MITTEKLKAFNDILKDTQIQVEELLRVRQNKKLFDNADDYYVQLKNCKYVPQDYYNCRLFDTYIELKFSRKSNEFYIRVDTTRFEFFRYLSHSEFISKYKLKTLQAYPEHFYISNNLEFNEVVKIFYRYCDLILSLYIGEENLFTYK